MKTILIFALMLTVIHAEDWTVGYKTYKNVTVTKVTDDHVEITFDGGVGSPKLASLPPELQKRFNYDPAKAKAAIDAENARLAQSDQERVQYDAQKISQAQTPSVSVQTVAPVSTKPAVNPAWIQQQIDMLQADIDAKNAEITRNEMKEERGIITSQSSFRSIVADDQAKIDQLRAQLH